MGSVIEQAPEQRYALKPVLTFRGWVHKSGRPERLKPQTPRCQGSMFAGTNTSRPINGSRNHPTDAQQQEVAMAASRKFNSTPFTIYCDEPEDDLTAQVDVYDEGAKPYQHSFVPTTVDSPVESVESASTNDMSVHNFSSTDTSSNENDTENRHERNEVSSPRRSSNITATSMSSLPESALPSEADCDDLSYTPTRPRPSYRGSSIRRIHLSSPSSDRTRLSPRPSAVFSTRPRSLRSAVVRASPRPRTRERQEEKDRLAYPLVLLHITLLPVSLPWSATTMQQVLPERAREALALLRSKSTETVLRRGILIPHPQEDFELLEERVLEALELVEARIGRGGEFRPRRDGWSGGSIVGLHVDEEDETAKSGEDDNETDDVADAFDDACEDEGDASRIWDVRIYAANGLMRAGAWAAAWGEMERVDVEVLPFIPDDTRKRLDELQVLEDAKAAEQRLQEDARAEAAAASAAAQQKALEAMYESRFERERSFHPMHNATTTALISQTAQPEPHQAPRQQKEKKNSAAPSKQADDIPAAYRPNQVPLDVLVRNYLYLLAQDRRNLAIIFLLVMVFFSSLHGMLGAKPSPALGLHTDDFHPAEMHPVSEALLNTTALNMECEHDYGSSWSANATDD
ncbi:hypothetical protein MBLNU459_g7277t3 [Dothideomycetes sp. NU459]